MDIYSNTLNEEWYGAGIFVRANTTTLQQLNAIDDSEIEEYNNVESDNIQQQFIETESYNDCIVCYSPTNTQYNHMNVHKICQYYIHKECYQKWTTDTNKACMYCRKKFSNRIRNGRDVSILNTSDENDYDNYEQYTTNAMTLVCVAVYSLFYIYTVINGMI
jgi:hypothetical protein